MDERTNTETRRQYLEINVVEPISGQTQTVLISYDRLHNSIKKRGMGEIMCAGHTVPHVLQNPTAVFERLCLDDDEDTRGYGWRCYSGIPEHDYSIDGRELEPRSDRVFVVFVNTEFVAYNWRWVKCDPFDSRLPIKHKTRFKRKLL